MNSSLHLFNPISTSALRRTLLTFVVLLLSSFLVTSVSAEKAAKTAKTAKAVKAAKPKIEKPKKELIVGTKVVKPFAYKNAKGKWTGISIELWRQIARKMGRDYVWKEASNTNTLVEGVKKGTYDVGIAAITVKPSRAKMVDFSDTHFKSSLGIATRLGSSSIFSMLGQFFTVKFLRPLAILIGILFFFGFLIWLFERKVNPDEFPEGAKGIWEGFWWSAVTMTTVGYGDKSPRSFFGRILGLFWMFASIIMISGLTGAIASSLTTQQLSSVIKGPEDLVNVRVGAKKGESPVAILKKKYNVAVTEFKTIKEGLEALKNNKIDAFVHDTPVLQSHLVEDKELTQKLVVLHKPIRRERYGIAITKPSKEDKRNQLREAVNKALIQLEIEGKLSEINAKYLGE